MRIGNLGTRNTCSEQAERTRGTNLAATEASIGRWYHLSVYVSINVHDQDWKQITSLTHFQVHCLRCISNLHCWFEGHYGRIRS
jgi:hypothetical protein